MDTGGDGVLGKSEVVRGVKVMGIKGPSSLLAEVFSAIDADGGGKIGFDELNGWLHGRASAATLCEKAIKGWRLHGLDEDSWRSELREHLARDELRPVDFLRVLDADRDGIVRKKEWLVAMKRLVSDELTWRGLGRDLAELIFGSLDVDGSTTLSVIELARWLNPRYGCGDGGGGKKSAAAEVGGDVANFRQLRSFRTRARIHAEEARRETEEAEGGEAEGGVTEGGEAEGGVTDGGEAEVFLREIATRSPIEIVRAMMAHPGNTALQQGAVSAIEHLASRAPPVRRIQLRLRPDRAQLPIRSQPAPDYNSHPMQHPWLVEGTLCSILGSWKAHCAASLACGRHTVQHLWLVEGTLCSILDPLLASFHSVS